MQDLFATPYRRRLLLIISVLALLLFLGVRFATAKYFLPPDAAAPASVMITLLDAVISTSIATISIAGLIYWLSPPIMNRSHLRPIEPREIRRSLDEARNDTSEWWYSGGAGRFTRAVTLPEMAKAARMQNASKKVVIQIIDPTNRISCMQYATYRSSLRSGSTGTWTVENLQDELYATIVAAYCWRAEQSRLDITVGLRAGFSTFRIDLSSTRAVITKEDPQEPAIECHARTYFYDAYFEDLRQGLKQARILPQVAAPTFGALDESTLSSLLSSLGIHQETVTPDRLQNIIALSKKQESPYA